MKSRNKIGVKGHYKITIKDSNGNYKNLWQENALGELLGIRIPFITGRYSTEYHKDNLIVDAGLAGIASRYNGDGSEDEFKYIAVGTDDTAAAAGNTTLGTEITDSGLSRALATASRETTTATNDTAKLSNEFSVTGTKAIKEVGVFNAASAGTMGSRTVITTKNVESGDTITIEYTLEVAEA
jgi:hypothetical protein